jgi:hypothetical protein
MFAEIKLCSLNQGVGGAGLKDEPALAPATPRATRRGPKG